MAPERRQAAVERFQGAARVKLALLSITAAGVGITLTQATAVVFVELWWNFGQLVQVGAGGCGWVRVGAGSCGALVEL